MENGEGGNGDAKDVVPMPNAVKHASNHADNSNERESGKVTIAGSNPDELNSGENFEGEKATKVKKRHPRFKPAEINELQTDFDQRYKRQELHPYMYILTSAVFVGWMAFVLPLIVSAKFGSLMPLYVWAIWLTSWGSFFVVLNMDTLNYVIRKLGAE